MIKYTIRLLLFTSLLLLSGCIDWTDYFSATSDDTPAPAPANPSTTPAQSTTATPANANTPAPLKTPQRISLLLPMQGSVASSSQTIKQGFMNAAQADPSVQVNTIDTTQQNVEAAYQQAVSTGSDFIVGPLTKPDVLSLIQNSPTISIPTLTLNYIDSSQTVSPNIYQFGLSPFDEAKQAAKLAKQRGLNAMIIIAPRSAWGEGVAEAFRAQWVALGGSVTTTLMYVGPNDSLSSQISNILQYKQSDDKNTVPTIRKDFDSIFLVANSDAARQIRPLLKYYYAGDIPVYSTSMVYSGKPQPNLDSDLDGIIFCDAPEVLNANNDTGSQGNLRLLALGNDAFHLAMQMNAMSQSPQNTYNGESGILSLDAQHRIVRQLTCAEFRNGTPIKLG